MCLNCEKGENMETNTKAVIIEEDYKGDYSRYAFTLE